MGAVVFRLPLHIRITLRGFKKIPAATLMSRDSNLIGLEWDPETGNFKKLQVILKCSQDLEFFNQDNDVI